MAPHTPVPSASPAIALPDLGLADQIRGVPKPAAVYQISNISNDGPMVVFDETDYDPKGHWAQRIWLANLVTGNVKPLAHSEGHAWAYQPAISGASVTWDEMEYSGANLYWRTLAYDIRTGARRELASGVNLYGLNGPNLPSLVRDRNLIAYNIELPMDHGVVLSRIVVQRVSDGAVVRDVRPAGPLLAIALDGTDVAYVEGRPNPNGIFVKTKLIVDHAGSPLRQIATYAYQLAFAGGRLSFTVPGAPDQAVGFSRGEQVMSIALGSESKATRVSRPPGVGGVQNSNLPAAGDGVVAWDETQDWGDVGGFDGLVVRDASTGAMAQLAQGSTVHVPSIGGGWIAWISIGDDTGLRGPGVYGVPVDQVRSALNGLP